MSSHFLITSYIFHSMCSFLPCNVHAPDIIICCWSWCACIYMYVCVCISPFCTLFLYYFLYARDSISLSNVCMYMYLWHVIIVSQYPSTLPVTCTVQPSLYYTCMWCCRLRVCPLQCRPQGQDRPGPYRGQPHLSECLVVRRWAEYILTRAKQEELRLHREHELGMPADWYTDMIMCITCITYIMYMITILHVVHHV